jgi:FKBP-type peptidyl-prolyl cis-trans isomerase FklB
MQKTLKITCWAAVGGLALFLAACDKASEPAEDTPQSASTQASVPASETVAPDTAASQPRFETAIQVASYGVGYQVGSDLARQTQQFGSKFETEAVLAGIKDALEEKEMRLDQDRIMGAFEEIRQASIPAEERAEMAANLQEAEAFLAANAEREGVVVLDSGLQYEVLQKVEDPDAPRPLPSDRVRVHYHGTLIDGTVFDSSVERGQPATFGVTQVIQGWVEALQLMQVGEKWKLYIHPDLAYGSRGRPSIPSNAALIFEVELLGIE